MANKPKRGDKHPTEDLYFWAISKGKEKWYSKEEFEHWKAYHRKYDREKRDKKVRAEASRRHRAKHPERSRAASRESYRKRQEKNPNYSRDAGRKYARENPERKRELHREWKAKNLEKQKAYHRAYQKTRRESDPMFVVGCRCRTRITDFYRNKGAKKASKTAQMIGCSWEELVAHLESQFTKGMTWDNRSHWHIDHRVPLASAETEEEIHKLCHYTNLQPLWATDNMSKGPKLDKISEKDTFLATL